jgi:hypothetical protein
MYIGILFLLFTQKIGVENLFHIFFRIKVSSEEINPIILAVFMPHQFFNYVVKPHLLVLDCFCLIYLTV